MTNETILENSNDLKNGASCLVSRWAPTHNDRWVNTDQGCKFEAVGQLNAQPSSNHQPISRLLSHKMSKNQASFSPSIKHHFTIKNHHFSMKHHHFTINQPINPPMPLPGVPWSTGYWVSQLGRMGPRTWRYRMQGWFMVVNVQRVTLGSIMF